MNNRRPLYTIAHSKRRPNGSCVFECALVTVTLQPINLLCYIQQSSEAGLRYIKSAIERCKGVKPYYPSGYDDLDEKKLIGDKEAFGMTPFPKGGGTKRKKRRRNNKKTKRNRRKTKRNRK